MAAPERPSSEETYIAPGGIETSEMPFSGQAVQLRILTGEFDISEPIDAVALHRIKRIRTRGGEAINLRPLQLAAKAARHEAYFGDTNPYEEKNFQERLETWKQQMEQWAPATDHVLDSLRTDTETAEFLDHFGLNKDDQDKPVSALDFYEKYLTTDEQLDTFIDLASQLSPEELTKHRSTLFRITSAFGEGPKRGIIRAIYGLKNAEADPEGFAAVNDQQMTRTEKELLQRLQELQTTGETIEQWQQKATGKGESDKGEATEQETPGVLYTHLLGDLEKGGEEGIATSAGVAATGSAADSSVPPVEIPPSPADDADEDDTQLFRARLFKATKDTVGMIRRKEKGKAKELGRNLVYVATGKKSKRK